MLAKDLKPEHNGRVFRMDGSVVVSIDDAVVGENGVLIKEGEFTWTFAANTEMEEVK